MYCTQASVQLHHKGEIFVELASYCLKQVVALACVWLSWVGILLCTKDGWF